MTSRIGTGSNFLLFRQMLSMANIRTAKYQEQLATLKRVNRPSDDPIGAQMLVGAREGNSRIDQFLRNLNAANRNWAQTETSVKQMTDVLNRASELAIQGNNGTLGAEQREIIAAEVLQLSQELLGLSNTKFDGQYIFGGFRTDALPFSFDNAHPDADPAAIYAGDSNVKNIEISDGQFLNIQLRIDDLLVGTGAPGESPAFQALADLEAALRANNIDDDDPDSVGSALDNINQALKDLQNRLASIGGQTNRIDQARDRLLKQKELNQMFISEIEDVDTAEAALKFQQAQLSLQAVIQSSSAILQSPSLLNFLK